MAPTTPTTRWPRGTTRKRRPTAGAYNWIASYSGDANNRPVAGTCGDAGETSLVGNLVVVKAVDKSDANYGDRLVYTLTGTAHTVNQTNVVITDTVPVGTTYLSSACAAPCTSSYNAATNEVTWSVGALAAGSSVSVTFTVRINRPPTGPGGSLPESVIDNVGAIRSTETPPTPSNVVHTVIPQVLPVVVVRPPPAATPPASVILGFRGILPKTGLSIPLSVQIPAALILIVTGCGLAFMRRNPVDDREDL